MPRALHGTAHKHPGISKMLQEIRQKYYYPGIVEHVKMWVEGCEICAKDKRVPNNKITLELLDWPECDLGPEMRCKSTCYQVYELVEAIKQ